MKYTVIKFFTDLQDNNHEYNVGDTFPREGKVVSDKRIAELSSEINAQGVPLIQKVQKVEDEPKEKEEKSKSASVKAKARKKTK